MHTYTRARAHTHTHTHTHTQGAAGLRHDPPGVVRHGSAERGIVVVAPGDPAVVATLKLLDEEFGKRTTRQKLWKMINSGNQSVREIQAGRIEIFVKANFKGSTAFDTITRDSQHLPPNTKVRPRLHYRVLTLYPATTVPVPRGLLTLWARAGMCVCMPICIFPFPKPAPYECIRACTHTQEHVRSEI